MAAAQAQATEASMWRQLVIDSFAQPRVAARRLIALDLPPDALLQAAGAVTCIGLVLGFAALRLTGGAADPVSAAVLRSPLVGAAVQFGVMALIALLTFRVGRMFGGRGGFWAGAAVVVWLNAMTLLIQAVQLVALALAPPAAGLIAVATLVWLFWAFANFVAELHGFASPFVVLGVAVLTVIVLVFAATLLAAILGVAPPAAS
jgi:hypothetical protein